MIGFGGSGRRLDPEAVSVVNISGVDSRTGRNHARGLIRANRDPTVLVEYLPWSCLESLSWISLLKDSSI